jgi:two-component system, response regulator YesN
MLISLFAVFFAATLVTGIVNYLSVRSALSEQTYAHNLEALRQTSRVIETVLDATDRMAVRLAHNRTVQSVSLADWQNIEEHYVALRQVRTMIEDELAASLYIHSVHLVNRVSDRALSVWGILPLDEFPDRVVLESVRSSALTSTWLGPRTTVGLDGRPATVITLLINIPAGISEARGLLIVNLDERLFFDTVVTRNHAGLGTIAILDEDSFVLSVADKSLLTERVSLSELYPSLGVATEDGYRIVDDNGSRSFVSIITSPYNRWRYLSVTPYGAVMTASRQVLVLAVGVSLLFLVLGLVLSVVVSRRFYRPIESLVSLVGLPSKNWLLSEVEADVTDEFEAIYASIDHLLKENKDYQDRYAATDAILREHFLIDLVLGRTRERPNLMREAQGFGLDLSAQSYSVMVLRIVSDALGQDGYEPQFRELRYRVYGIATTILNRYARGFVVDFGKTDVVIGVLGDSEDLIETCRRIAEETHRVITADMGIGTSYGIGACQNSYDTLATSYDQAKLALEYAKSTDSGSIVAMDDVVADSQLYSIILSYRSTIEEILQTFRQQRYDDAVEAAAAFAVTVGGDRRIGRMQSTMLLHEFLGAFLSMLISFDVDLDSVYGPDAHLFHDLALQRSAEDAQHWLRACVRSAAHHLSQRNTIRRRDFVHRTEAFVQAHYARPIGLNEAADHLHMNRQYFCSVFKTAFGTTFGEYLSTHRVTKALDLLTESTRSVGEIASAVGFTSIRSFNRTFRALKGVTPAKYRVSMQMGVAEPE